MDTTPQKLCCGKCGHEWLQFIDSEDWIDHVSCPQCGSDEDWALIFDAKRVPDLPPDFPGIEPFEECPICGEPQILPDDADNFRLLFQQCSNCGYERRAGDAGEIETRECK